MKSQKHKDEYWWIHPKFKAKQTLTLDDVNILNEIPMTLLTVI